MAKKYRSNSGKLLVEHDGDLCHMIVSLFPEAKRSKVVVREQGGWVQCRAEELMVPEVRNRLQAKDGQASLDILVYYLDTQEDQAQKVCDKAVETYADMVWPVRECGICGATGVWESSFYPYREDAHKREEELGARFFTDDSIPPRIIDISDTANEEDRQNIETVCPKCFRL